MTLKLELVEGEGKTCNYIAFEDISWKVPMNPVKICIQGKGYA